MPGLGFSTSIPIFLKHASRRLGFACRTNDIVMSVSFIVSPLYPYTFKRHAYNPGDLIVRYLRSPFLPPQLLPKQNIDRQRFRVQIILPFQHDAALIPSDSCGQKPPAANPWNRVRQRSPCHMFLLIIVSVQSEINGDTPDMHLNFYADIILLFL